MSSSLTETLDNLTIDALSQCAFMFADPIGIEDAAELPHAVYFVCIRYNGPLSGTVSLAASEGFVREFAAGLLGEDPEAIILDEEGTDAFRELANIIGGSVVFSLGGDQIDILLGLPEDMSHTSMPSKDDAQIYSYFSSEGERLEIALSSLISA